jgi:hypothetical protein
MNIKQTITSFTVTIMTVCTVVFGAIAQTENINNTDNENVTIDQQELGDDAQQQGQSAEGGSSQVTITEEDADNNFWTNGYRGLLSVPPGGASIICKEQAVSFSRTEGVGFGVGAAGINFSDNSGQSPEEFEANLAAIRECAKEKNASDIMNKYVNLLGMNEAIANTYLRAVSPELYATFVVENARLKGSVVSRNSYLNLTNNLRNGEFNKVVEWQDNYHAVGLDERRTELQRNQEMRSIQLEKQLAELEVLELQRKSRELDAILQQQQLNLQQFQK